jgi:hypothetical protein
MAAGDLQLQRITILTLDLLELWQRDGPYTVPWDKMAQPQISPQITLDFLLVMLKKPMERALDQMLISSLLLFTSGPQQQEPSSDIKLEQECSEVPRHASMLGQSQLSQLRLT